MIDIKNPEFIEEFKKYKVAAIDLAFKGTSLAKGAHEARIALKYILFNYIEDSENLIEDKYLYISSKFGGRELIKLVDKIDIIHILVKFSMQSFAMFNKAFSFDENKFDKYYKTKKITLKDEDLIEFIAYSSFRDSLVTYFILTKHKYLAIQLFDLFVDYRYKNNLLKKLDSFNGIINNQDIDVNTVKRYAKQYLSLDEDYRLLKETVNL